MTFLVFIVLSTIGTAQHNHHHFTQQDTLRGTITPERAWWDLTYYHLEVSVHPETKSLKGSNTISYQVLESKQILQIDLQDPLILTKAEQSGQTLQVKKVGNAHFVTLNDLQIKGTKREIKIHYEGVPVESKRPPWEAVMSWKKDKNGIDFITTTCQGEGASMWWPCKDHMYDEPEGMKMSITVPGHLVDVSNGRLEKTDKNRDGTKTYHWVVKNPISNYCVNLNIGDYVSFSEKYNGEKGKLDCTYYVLRDDKKKAKKHFREVPKMLEAFEHWFGPYPFYEDSYKLVQVPYPGMEHQSSVTYGNGFENGYGGRDLSQTGVGMKWDFIIVHESGHEWFANNITYKDMADMWIHEGFTAYSENLFVNYHFSKKEAEDYVIGTRSYIQNDVPIIAPYDVNASGSGDMYYKGANMLHTLRQVINDDEKWRSILRGLNKDFYHQTVTTHQIETYISEKVGMDLEAFFTQYLRDVRIPVFEYRFLNGKLAYRWSNTVKGFAIPLKVYLNGQEKWLQPTASWQNLENLPKKPQLKIDRNFYVIPYNVMGN